VFWVEFQRYCGGGGGGCCWVVVVVMLVVVLEGERKRKFGIVT